MSKGGGFQVKDAEPAAIQQKKFDPGVVTGGDASHFDDPFFSEELGYEAIFNSALAGLGNAASHQKINYDVEERTRRLNLRNDDRKAAALAATSRSQSSQLASSSGGTGIGTATSNVLNARTQAALLGTSDEDFLGI